MPTTELLTTDEIDRFLTWLTFSQLAYVLERTQERLQQASSWTTDERPHVVPDVGRA